MYSLTTTSSLSWIVVIIGLGNFLFVERSRLASTCRRYVNLAFQKLFSYTTTNPITLNNRWDVCSKSDLFIFFMKETLLLLLAIPSVQALGSLLNRIVVSRDQKCWNNTTPAAVTHGRTPVVATCSGRQRRRRGKPSPVRPAVGTRCPTDALSGTSQPKHQYIGRNKHHKLLGTLLPINSSFFYLCKITNFLL